MGSLLNAATLACESKCGATAGCVGFTRKDAEQSCYFYSGAQVSGLFSHGRPGVSWHPKPHSHRAIPADPPPVFPGLQLSMDP